MVRVRLSTVVTERILSQTLDCNAHVLEAPYPKALFNSMAYVAPMLPPLPPLPVAPAVTPSDPPRLA
eukprot:CAMPEP_0175923854 /NCGR_PEP_ID=MMETSP0108-20121206/14790_2 /TAXON_ID=195067 ORGANISM="Goniomonas pacifica, Strain CCMP1869" /NCGR_SAMPLE_ID=MMETSP0108 /ASSEMBLY_ACC=CAM_ASM_000204 /LENGTH=66 /DNA_ID=CAMNT_0017246877 /DNA_START=40 /DNA_END=241 /DNA_ORIENTATION=-